MEVSNLHQKYWKRMTVASTYEYCEKMLTLSSNPYQKVSKEKFKDKCKEYVEKLIDYNNQKILADKILEIKELSPFPDDICGMLHEHTGEGIFQPKHLMYKLGVLKVDHILFEFLIEYGILESDVEIYYGIKAISMERKTSDAFAEKVIEMSEGWFDYMRKGNKTKGNMGINVREHKFTNNVHDGTFWISWLRVESKMDLFEVIKKLDAIIYKHFKIFLRDDLKLEAHELADKLGTDFASKVQRANENLTTNIGATQIQLDKPEVCSNRINRMMEDACNVRDKKDGTPLLTKKGDFYCFNCSDSDARIFIKMLFNPKPFRDAYKITSEWYTFNEENKTDIAFSSFMKKRSGEEQQKLWKNAKKETLDRKFILETFRNVKRGEYKKSWLTKPFDFDEMPKFKQIKEMVERYDPDLIVWIDRWIDEETNPMKHQQKKA